MKIKFTLALLSTILPTFTIIPTITSCTKKVKWVVIKDIDSVFNWTYKHNSDSKIILESWKNPLAEVHVTNIKFLDTYNVINPSTHANTQVHISGLEDQFFINSEVENVDISKTSITEIPIQCFAGCRNLQHIYLPSSCTYIGANAFAQSGIRDIDFTYVNDVDEAAFLYCTNLKEVYLPSSIIYVGDQAFCGCNGLKKVYWDCNCENTGDQHEAIPNEPLGYTFNYDCNLSSFTFGPTAKAVLKRISMQTFWNCTSLKNIDIPDGVETIGDVAFWNTGLTSFKIPSSLQIPYDSNHGETYNPFACSDISSWNTNGNLNFFADDKQNLYVCSLSDDSSPSGYPTLLSVNLTASSYTIPSSVKYITPCALTSRFIKTVDAEDGTVLSISSIYKGNQLDYNAWAEDMDTGGKNSWASLQSINLINVSCPTIPELCFCNSQWLSSVILPYNCSYLGNNAFEGTSVKLDQILSTSNISAISCGVGVFNALHSDTSSISPTDIKKIILSDLGLTPTSLFAFISSLHTIEWNSNSFTSAGITTSELENSSSLHSTFAGCKNLANVDLSGMTGLKELSGTFTSDYVLDDAILPSNVSSMSGAFENCTGLTSLTFLGNLNNFNSDQESFRNCSSITNLYFPNASIAEPVSTNFNSSLFAYSYFSSGYPTIHLPNSLSGQATQWVSNFPNWNIVYDLTGGEM